MNDRPTKTALVTGSSRGLGRPIAERLARDGALVVVHGRDEDAADQTVKAITSAGGRAFAVHADIGTTEGIDALFTGIQAGLVEHTGAAELDILVNNAGFSHGQPPEDISPDDFDRLIAVNARAPLFIIQRALPMLRDGGRIVNVSTALTRYPWVQEIAYAMSKGALEQLSLHFARYLGPRGITINTVAPGTSDNGSGALDDNPEMAAAIAELSAFGRWGEAETISDVVAFLASDQARWITGAWIDASGGVLV